MRGDVDGCRSVGCGGDEGERRGGAGGVSDEGAQLRRARGGSPPRGSPRAGRRVGVDARGRRRGVRAPEGGRRGKGCVRGRRRGASRRRRSRRARGRDGAAARAELARHRGESSGDARPQREASNEVRSAETRDANTHGRTSAPRCAPPWIPCRASRRGRATPARSATMDATPRVTNAGTRARASTRATTPRTTSSTPKRASRASRAPRTRASPPRARAARAPCRVTEATRSEATSSEGHGWRYLVPVVRSRRDVVRRRSVESRARREAHSFVSRSFFSSVHYVTVTVSQP